MGWAIASWTDRLGAYEAYKIESGFGLWLWDVFGQMIQNHPPVGGLAGSMSLKHKAG